MQYALLHSIQVDKVNFPAALPADAGGKRQRLDDEDASIAAGAGGIWRRPSEAMQKGVRVAGLRVQRRDMRSFASGRNTRNTRMLKEEGRRNAGNPEAGTNSSAMVRERPLGSSFRGIVRTEGELNSLREEPKGRLSAEKNSTRGPEAAERPARCDRRTAVGLKQRIPRLGPAQAFGRISVRSGCPPVQVHAASRISGGRLAKPLPGTAARAKWRRDTALPRKRCWRWRRAGRCGGTIQGFPC